jgi:hypothetical protein
MVRDGAQCLERICRGWLGTVDRASGAKQPQMNADFRINANGSWRIPVHLQMKFTTEAQRTQRQHVRILFSAPSVSLW